MIPSLIYDFAKKNGGVFHLQDLLKFLYYQDQRIIVSILVTLDNMMRKGEIIAIDRDLYQVRNYPKDVFKIHPNPLDLNLHTFLKRSFPFATICIWNIQELTRFMHHIPNINFTIIEVEKDLISSVSDRLSEINGHITLTNPPLEIFQSFVSFKNLIILKKLISQAPLTNDIEFEKYCSFPRLEKILVDILCDNEFYFLHGMETKYVYQNAFDSCQINVNMLMRYASRRNKQKDVESLLGNI